MHSGGSDQTTVNCIKKRKGSVKISTTIYKTSFSIHFHFLLHLLISNLKIISCYHSTFNLCTTRMTSQYIANILPIYRQYIANISELAMKISFEYISAIYRDWPHSLGTRSAVKILKVFTTNEHEHQHLFICFIHSYIHIFILQTKRFLDKPTTPHPSPS